VARYAGLTRAPDESGSKRREKGLAKAGNARVSRGMIQLAWRFLLHQKDSALTQWYRARTVAGRKRKTALARKLLIALWRLVTVGESLTKRRSSVSDDDPRGRSPEAGHPVSRMGPPPRSFAADAHDCIMVRSLLTYRIQGCGALIRARWQAPPRTASLFHY
jgi:Transposase IS116/IS110/IS902 family